MAEEDKKVSGARMSLFKQLLDGLFVTKAAMTTAISTLSSTIAGKVDKVDGKGLSANDYTASDKTKLSGLANIKTVGDGLNLINGNLVGVVVTGATATNAGKRGIVPAPYPGDQDRFLKGNGSWAIPPNTTYTAGENIAIDGTTISATVPPSTVIDTTENWTTNNTVLKLGQIGIENRTDGYIQMKVGDGITAWTKLQYIGVFGYQ